MKLYVDGCSFTHGHLFNEWPTGIPGENEYSTAYKEFSTGLKPHCNFVWPTHLEKSFDVTLNAALQGSGLSHMSRQVTSFINTCKDEIDDWVLVLQVSTISRSEELDLFEPAWNVIHLHDGDAIDIFYHVGKTIVDRDTTIKKSEDYYDALDKYHRTVMSNSKYLAFKQAQLLLMLTSVLDNINAKYLITGMSRPDYYPHELSTACDQYLDDTKYLTDLMNKENFVESFCEVLQDNNPEHYMKYYDETGHPNKKGHERFAKYILSQIEKRGWL